MAALPRPRIISRSLSRQIPTPNGLPNGFYDRLVQEMQSRRPELIIQADYPLPNGTITLDFPYDITTDSGLVLATIRRGPTHLSIRIQRDNENLLADVTSAVEAALAQGGGRRRVRKGTRKARKTRKGNRKHKTRGRK